MSSAASVRFSAYDHAQMYLDEFNNSNTDEDGHCPPLTLADQIFVPVSEIRNAQQYTTLMEAYRRSELYQFAPHVVTAVNNYHEAIKAGLYDSILRSLRPSQQTAYTCLAYYQLTGRTYNDRSVDFSQVIQDPNHIIPDGILPALVQLPTAAGKSWLIGATAVTKKTLVVVPNGGIRSGFTTVFQRQFPMIGVDPQYLILDPTAKHDIRNGCMNRLDADSNKLTNDCRLLVTTYQALTDPETLSLLFDTFGRNSPIEQVIFDEGHHSAAFTYRNILKRAYELNPNLHVVNFTALIERLDGQYIRHVRVYSLPLSWARKTSVVADIRVNSIEFDVEQIVTYEDGGDRVVIEEVGKKKRKATDPVVAFTDSTIVHIDDNSSTSSDSTEQDGSGSEYQGSENDDSDSNSEFTVEDVEEEYHGGETESSSDEESVEVGDDVDDDGLTKHQRRIAKAMRDNESMQKYVINKSIRTLINRAHESRTYIAMLFACKDQPHAKDVEKWTKQVIDGLEDPRWKHLLKTELIISQNESKFALVGSEGSQGTRKNAHERVKQGMSNIIVQVFMYSEGVDIVPIKIVTFLCPRSKHIAYQILGRGLRLFVFNDPTHNGRWFNPDHTNMARMSWNHYFTDAVTIGSQFDLVKDNVLDVIVPTVFDMLDDIKSLDSTLTMKVIDFDREGLLISNGVKSLKKKKTEHVELLWSGAESTANDMEGNTVQSVPTSLPAAHFQTEDILRSLSLEFERAGETNQNQAINLCRRILDTLVNA